ncbi:MAG: hypothetical protein VF00_C0017G0009 [candidate division Kazan bacterium GW2011_GWB1_52_7]|uniref:Uncharacterized protein n=1 Tax=candidate division Kazan bacterium GW2011_GWB1_52_7 TaxID=1620414 RepID=A0A0G1X4T4_UNCK3|nr:MAG: hypothetical protein VF00_C0017G0009 [candidate division Kazan bacterium GW2011_GWB1_52_7]
MFEQVLAHEGEEEELPISPLGETLDQRLKGLSLLGLELATGLALFLIILAVFWKKKTEKAKWFLYLGIALHRCTGTPIFRFGPAGKNSI